LAYMAAWDVRQAKIFGICKSRTGGLWGRPKLSNLN
jgi:hypothetical protein